MPLSALASHVLDCNILIADDSRINCEVLRAYLNHAGWRNITAVPDGESAIAHLATHPTDLMLLDLSMPNGDGFEVCEHVRASAALAQLPVIVQTGFTGTEERQRAFDAGATDFVTKPLFREELVARVRLQLENRLLVGRLQRYHGRLSAELETARDMQHQLVPDDRQRALALEGLPLNMATRYVPVTELGGDIWGLRRLSPTQLAFYAGDFSGHGVGPAIHTFQLSTVLNRLPTHIARHPEQSLAAVTRELAAGLPLGQYLALFYGVYDSVLQEVSYSAVAMPPPVLLQKNRKAELVPASGVPIGLDRAPLYTARTMEFTAGSQLLLYSDGLLAGSRQVGGSLTPRRLAARLRGRDFPDSKDLLAAALAIADINGEPVDDMTLVALSHNEL